MIQKPTLLLKCINADIAKVVTAFVREQLPCNANQCCIFVLVEEDAGCFAAFACCLQICSFCSVVADVIADLPHMTRQKPNHTTPQRQLGKFI